MVKNATKREMRFSKVSASIVRETEKAFQVVVAYWTKADKPSKEAKMWCPKSCCKVIDGKVVEIAEFILNNWTKEHNDYIRTLTHVVPNVSFDMDEKESVLAHMREDERIAREAVEEKVSRISAKAEPFATKFMQELAWVCMGAGMYMKDAGHDADACDEMIALGKKISKVFGAFGEETIEDYVARLRTVSESDVTDLMYMMLDTWIYDGLRVAYDNTIAREGFTKDEFHSVRDNLDKVFKKNVSFKAKYNELYGRVVYGNN